MNEQQIRAALRGVAEAPGRPDEGAAWARIADGIARDAAGAARRRRLLGGAGVAVAGAAAALVLVLGAGDDQEAVEVGPADQTTTSVASAPTTATTTPTTAPEDPTALPPEVLGGLPDRPLAVVVASEAEGVQRLDLHDADTGALVVRGLVRSHFGISDVSVVDGTVYFTAEGGDSEAVRSVPWDGSAPPSSPPGVPPVEEEPTRSGVRSPDGSTFAFVEQGVTRPEGRIALVDVATGARRVLEWDEGEDDFFLTGGRIDDLAFSPDGTRLAFTSSYEGDETFVVDLAASSLSEARPLAGAIRPAWTDDGGIVAVRLCCYPDFEEQGALVRISVDAPDTGTSVGEDDDLLDVAVGDGLVATVSASRGVEVGDQGGTDRTTIAVDGTPVEIGF